MLSVVSGADDWEWGRPYGLALDPGRGTVYATDERRGTVVRVDASGGATEEVARGLCGPQGLALCPSRERLLVCEPARGRVRAVDLTTGALEAAWEGLGLPSGAAAAPSAEELYVCCAGSHAVFARDLRCRAHARVVAGVPGTAGNMKTERCGDGGDALQARLYSPGGLALAGDEAAVYIADSYNGRVRAVEDGLLRTVAGADQSAPRGNHGPATEINIGQTRGVAWSPGFGLIVTASPAVVWRLKGSEMVPVAGTWVDGYNGDEGDALEMRLSTPCGVACWDEQSCLFVADSGNRRVCRVELA